MENNIIMLEDEHGCMIEFETIDVFEFEGVTYFALLEVLPEGQENVYDTVTDIIIQTLTTVIKQEQIRIKRQQRRGIETLKESTAWEDYGRPSITLPDNYIEVMDRWLAGNITANAAMGLMGLRRTTFYKLAKLYKEGDLIV